jgi:multidrug resistance efflux pump
MNRKFLSLFIITSLVALLLSACAAADANASNQNITASGTISAVSINISPEVGGKVVEVLAKEGQQVNKGDTLFRIDDEILKAQYNQADAAVKLADAGIEAARQQLNAAETQVLRAEQGARLLELQSLQTTPPLWSQTLPSQFEQPNWYYQKTEALEAAKNEVENATRAVDLEKNNLEQVLAKSSNGDFIDLEQTLANARARFLVADTTLKQATGAQNGATLKDVAQKEYDAALADLETVQRDYDRMLTTTAAAEVLEARAKLAVANARLQNAQNQMDGYLTGDQSLDVQAAQANAASAAAVLTQAQAGKNQASAALQLLEIQLKKSTVVAPASGTIMAANIQDGELVGPGSIVFTIGQLEQVSLTVYIPEDAYGQILLGKTVDISVDSYPGKTFKGEVVRIADQAEFTPRNVQTVEGRKTTVYAVEISINNADNALKPGMPADVDFGIAR